MAKYAIGDKIIEANSSEEALAKYRAGQTAGGGAGAGAPASNAPVSGRPTPADSRNDSANGIMARLRAGEIDADAAYKALLAVGIKRDIAEEAVSSFRKPAQAPPTPAPPNPPGGPATPPGGGPGAPTAPVGPVGPPGTFTDLMDMIGESDVSRNFALQSGVAPGFRNLVQGRAQREALPYALQALMGSGNRAAGSPLEDLISTRGFQDFLGQGQGMSNIGNTLRSAGNFVRSPGMGQDFSAQQEAIMDRLLGPEGSIGSERFSPLIGMAAGAGSKRPVAGFDISGAIQRSLQNALARDPMRFKDPSEFIDFMTQQRIF